MPPSPVIVVCAVTLISVLVKVLLIYKRENVLDNVLSLPDCAQLVTSGRLKIPSSLSNWWSKVDLFPSHAGKEIVRPVLFDNIPAVLKLKRLPEKCLSIAETIRGTQTTPLEHVRRSVQANYHEGVTEPLLNRIESEDLESIFCRLQQPEYFFLLWASLLKRSSPHFPRLLGTCGEVYIVENVEEVLNEEFIRSKSWNEMQPVINSFISLTEHLNHVSIQLCDVKLDNFGWDPSTQEVKMVDLDTAFFTGSLQEQFRERQCVSDEDCHLFSCRGCCDVPNRKCLVKIADNNLVRICREIFAPRFMEMGLFSGAPLAKKERLFKLAKNCGRFQMDWSDFRSAYQPEIAQ
ncbi:hypothetical protein RvY_19193 [Ramazzottius varieornatus]|uniref:FAM69 protein-kinase domain-containing protein n=1 Tax=Ramazzottius varieornatus TaxID=947166 RepID=A0A1D1W8L4_RAMVA|nr:hypothetical protein RvY_19193 [Ramazzottius varieornatus]